MSSQNLQLRTINSIEKEVIEKKRFKRNKNIRKEWIDKLLNEKNSLSFF
jgi:hypothetical protein